MEKPICNTECVAEVFRLQMPINSLKRFTEKKDAIHRHFSCLSGYESLELFLLSSTEVWVIVRWNNYRDFEMHLSQVLNAPEIRDWLKEASSVTHQPCIVKKAVTSN